MHEFMYQPLRSNNSDLEGEELEPCLSSFEDTLEEEGSSLAETSSTTTTKLLIPKPKNLQMVSYQFRTLVKTFLKLLLKVLISAWKLASSFAIIIFFASWYYGGFLPYLVSMVALLSIGYHFSDSLLYQPDTPSEARVYVPSPTLFSLPFETVNINTSDRVKLHAYLLKQPKSVTCPTIIYFHGNAGNIGHRLENAHQLFNKLKSNVLLVEYRGYGLSEGSPSESGFYRDAKAAFEFVENRDDLNGRKIIIFGRSLGGAVAIDLASRCDFRDRVMALIVENTFTSIPSLAKHLFPIRIIRYIPHFCYKNRYESGKKISKVTCPTLFLSGLNDELIPSTMMAELDRRCTAMTKLLVEVPGGGHNDTWTVKGYMNHISNFLNKVLEENHTREYTPFNSDINIV